MNAAWPSRIITDIQAGDVIECFEVEEVARAL